jgi:hypothetical protein
MEQTDRYKPTFTGVDKDGHDTYQTKCNFFVQDWAKTYSYSGFADKRANEIHDTVVAPGSGWKIVDFARAQELANQGKLVIAAYRNPDANAPGHVAAVVPGSLARSDSWDMDVPRIAQAGPPSDRALGGVSSGMPLSFGFGSRLKGQVVTAVWDP